MESDSPTSVQEPAPSAGTGGKPSRCPGWLRVVLCVFVALHLGYTFASPRLAGADEREHLAYIRSLADHGTLPAFDRMRNDFDARPMVIYTGFHGPLYYASMVPAYLAARPLGEAVTERVLRHANALYGILFILLSYHAFRRVLRDPLLVIGAVTATALHPLTLYLSSHVTNDVLAAVWVALVFYCLARIISGEEQRELAWWAGVGAAAALGMLSKYTAIVAFAAAFLVIVLRSRQCAKPVAAAATRLGLLLAAFLLLDGWWLVRNLLVYHELLPIQYHQPLFPNGLGQALLLPDVTLPLLLTVLWEFVLTYFGPLWLFQRVEGYFLFWTAIVWIPLFLWPITGWLRRRKDAELEPSREERFLYGIALAAFAANVLGVLNTVLFQQTTMMFFIGRFMLCSLPGMMLLLCVGVSRHSPLPRHRRAAVMAFSYLVAAQNLWIIPGIWLLYRS